jgi:hypothetical protein
VPERNSRFELLAAADAYFRSFETNGTPDYIPAPLLPEADRRAQRPGLMMAAIYRTLLGEIERDGFHVLNQKISLTPLRKLWLAWKTYVRS